VQARTALESDPGFVFLNSRITHGPGPAGNDVPPGSSYLARPGPATSWDKVSYINCRIDRHIAGGRVLGASEAARFSTRERIFAGFDGGRGWNPARSE
jgi:hypothetical protein